MGAWYQRVSRSGGQSGWRYSSSNELAFSTRSPVDSQDPGLPQTRGPLVENRERVVVVEPPGDVGVPSPDDQQRTQQIAVADLAAPPESRSELVRRPQVVQRRRRRDHLRDRGDRLGRRGVFLEDRLPGLQFGHGDRHAVLPGRRAQGRLLERRPEQRGRRNRGRGRTRRRRRAAPSCARRRRGQESGGGEETTARREQPPHH